MLREERPRTRNLLAMRWDCCSTRNRPHPVASVITATAANGYHLKTGQREVAGTFMFYRVIPYRGKFNLQWLASEPDFQLPSGRQPRIWPLGKPSGLNLTPLAH